MSIPQVQPLLSIEALSLSYGDVILLDNINLQLHAAEVMVLMGANGAGKSSLLRVLSHDLGFDRGAIYFNQRNIEQWPAAERARLMAVLPQHSSLNFPFTAEEVVMLSRTPHASGVVQDKKIVSTALAQVDAEHLAQRLYTQLSGGEKQRVQLARVLAQIAEPQDNGMRLLLLDEPASAFDMAHQMLLFNVIKEIKAQGIAVLMVLHDLNMAQRCADKVVLLQSGRVYAQGVTADVLNTDNIKAVFDVDVNIIEHAKTGRAYVMA